MTGGHGRISYCVKRDGNLFRYGRVGEIGPLTETELAAGSSTESYAYTHIFGQADLADLPSEAALHDLGEAMMPDPGAADIDSPIPAGYTYFGQFVFHDMTFLTPGHAQNGRSPALDLDSVLPTENDARYRDESCTFGALKIGTTTHEEALPGDLPREHNDACPGKPVIADERNDDFLPLAQCHLMLLKFYNAVAQHCGYDSRRPPDKDLLKRIREIWVKHFQWAVLHDYLPRMVGNDVHRSVMTKGRVIVHPESFRDPSRTSLRANPRDRDWMPLEFGAAVGRFGHSMIRSEYRPWNVQFAEQGMPPVTLGDFMMASYRNSGDHLGGMGRGLSTMWTTNWLVLFDFAKTRYPHQVPRPIMANKINTNLAGALKRLPERVLAEQRSDRQTFNLAGHTLRHGRRKRLVTAQEAIRQLNSLLTPDEEILELRPSQLWDDWRREVQEAFRQHEDLGSKTPLWYYVLREAETLGRGDRLGPLGGRIVMETLHAAIEASEISILDGTDWKPELPRGHTETFTVPDMITFSGDPDLLGTARRPR